MDIYTLIAREINPNEINESNINVTSTDPLYISEARKYCTIDRQPPCPIEWATMQYRPGIPGNMVYLSCFVILLAGQIFYGIRKKTWTYLVALTIGVGLESAGYVGRFLMNRNPFILRNFLMNLVPLTIAPALLTAGIYLCLGRVITAIGSEHSRLKPKMYTYIFVGFDLMSLVLQAIGGAMAATADDKDASQKGTNIMIGGLISQVISMVLFFIVWGDFVQRTRRARRNGSLHRTQPPLYEELRGTRTFLYFQWSLFAATVLIFIRCIYRVAELWGGFDSHLANDELTFMIFEGPMIILAVAAMTIFHPGRVFDRLWVPAGKGLRSAKLTMTPSTTELTGTEDWKTNTAYQRV